MRRFLNKPLKDGKETYAKVLVLMLTGPENGQNTTYDEMRRTVPLLEKLEMAADPEVGIGNILLEDAEWEMLCKRLKAPNTGFLRNEREALDMCEDIFNAEHINASDLEFEQIQDQGEDRAAEA